MQNNIFKNMLILATGSLAARGITFMTIPILTRIYQPDHFGILATFIAIIALFLPFSNLKYSTAIPLPKHELISIHIIILCLFLLTTILLIVIVCTYFFSSILFELLSIQEISTYWWIIPFSLFFNGLYEIFNMWATRNKSFKILSTSLFIQSFLGTLIKIILGLLNFKPMGLLIGHIITQSGGVLFLIKDFLLKLNLNKKRISIRKIIFIIKYYKSYPKYKLPSYFLYTLSFQAPLLFTSSFYGIEITGQLGLSFMALALPISLFGQTTSKSYYAEIAKIGNKKLDTIYKITKHVSKKLFLFSLFPFFLLLFFSPYIFEILFGSEWKDAGEYTQILALYLLMQFVTSPIMQVFNVINRQKEVLIIHLRRVILVIFVFITGYYLSMDIKYILIAYSLLLSIHYLLIYLRVLTLLKKGKNEKII